MTAQKAAGARPPVPIAGVVDGELTTVSDHDGNVCVYLTFGSGPLCDGAQVELVLSRDGARALQRSRSRSRELHEADVVEPRLVECVDELRGGGRVD